MSFGWKKAVLAGATAFMLGSAVHAADFDGSPGSNWYSSQEQSSEYGSIYEAPAQPHRFWHERRFYGERAYDGFYGRPVAEYRPWQRPVFARPAWSYGGECRVIIKERVNPWGERDIRRIRVCD